MCNWRYKDLSKSLEQEIMTSPGSSTQWNLLQKVYMLCKCNDCSLTITEDVKICKCHVTSNNDVICSWGGKLDGFFSKNLLLVQIWWPWTTVAQLEGRSGGSSRRVCHKFSKPLLNYWMFYLLNVWILCNLTGVSLFNLII